MAKARENQDIGEEIIELRQDITDLKDHIRVLSDILDEIRVELGWLARNGCPASDIPQQTPVLKRMAFDPLAADWSERLEIVRGDRTGAPGTGSRDETLPADRPTTAALSASRSGAQATLF